MITKNEIFDLLTIYFKNREISIIMDYLLFMDRYPFCTFHLRQYTLYGGNRKKEKYLQININHHMVLLNVQITNCNRKLLKPFIARVEGDICGYV